MRPAGNRRVAIRYAYHTGFCPAAAVTFAADRVRPGILMQTSRRDIFLLACCQALLLTNASGVDLDERTGRLFAGADEGAGDARRDDVRARLGAGDDADVAVDGARRPPRAAS